MNKIKLLFFISSLLVIFLFSNLGHSVTIEDCQGETKESSRQQCFLALATGTLDYNFCYYVNDKNAQTNCLYLIALQLKDLPKCKQFTDVLVQFSCEQANAKELGINKASFLNRLIYLIVIAAAAFSFYLRFRKRYSIITIFNIFSFSLLPLVIISSFLFPTYQLGFQIDGYLYGALLIFTLWLNLRDGYKRWKANDATFKKVLTLSSCLALWFTLMLSVLSVFNTYSTTRSYSRLSLTANYLVPVLFESSIICFVYSLLNLYYLLCPVRSPKPIYKANFLQVCILFLFWYFFIYILARLYTT